MQRATLGISLLNGAFKAAALRRGATAGTWERPQALGDLGQVGAILREAAGQARPAGKAVALVLTHPQLSHQVVEVPPAKGWALEQFLDRRARASKAFEGAPAWSRQPALPTRKGKALLLHLCPKSVVDQLNRGCAEAGLDLARVVPAASVLAAQLKQLPIGKEEVALLAAETGATTTVVVGRKDGQVCLARVLLNSLGEAHEQVALNLNRTIGFAEQQSGLLVDSVWLFGPCAAGRLSQMQSLVKTPVRVSPVECTPFYWAEQAVRLPSKEDGNLLTAETLEAPKRRRFLTLTSVLLLLFLITSLGTAGYLELLRRSQLNEIAKLDLQILHLQEKHKEWKQRYDDLAHKKELVRLVQEDEPPPVAGSFMAYLGQVTEDDIVLTHLRLARTNRAWALRLEGAMQPVTDRSSRVFPASGFVWLTNRLVTGPFHLEITGNDPGGRAPPPPTVPESGPWDTNRFWIEGVMR